MFKLDWLKLALGVKISELEDSKVNQKDKNILAGLVRLKDLFP